MGGNLNLNLDDEGDRLTQFLRGKTVKVIRRHRPAEVLIEFDDGTRLFVNNVSAGLEFSITG
jgi:hypothetical protein